MEKKERGTFKIDRNLTPKDNINNLLKQVYPVEVTLSKMNPQNFEHYRYRNGNKEETVLLQNVDVFPLDKYNSRGSTWGYNPNPSPQEIFARIGFGLKTNVKYCKRRGRDGYVARWSVPIKNEKVSISQVKNIFEEMQTITKEIEEYSSKREADDKIRQEKQETRKIYIEEIRKLAKVGAYSTGISSNIDAQGYNNEELPAYYRFTAGGLNKEQAIAISHALEKIANDPALMAPENEEKVNE